MDIAALSYSMSKQNVSQTVGVAMLSKSLDQAQTESAGIMKMIDASAIERSVNPAVGSNIDIRL